MADESDSIPSLTLEVLKDIRGDMREAKGDIREMKHDIRTLNVRMESVEGTVIDLKIEMSEVNKTIHSLNDQVQLLTGEVTTLNDRFDHFLELGGEAHRSLDRRVGTIEAHLFGAGSSRSR